MIFTWITPICSDILINKIKEAMSKSSFIDKILSDQKGNKSLNQSINASVIFYAVTGVTLIHESSLFAHSLSHSHKLAQGRPAL